mgnify:CR=1 FL=1
MHPGPDPHTNLISNEWNLPFANPYGPRMFFVSACFSLRHNSLIKKNAD